MAAKPILDISHRGKRIRVEFAIRKGAAMRYNIFLEDRPIKVDLFAEEVMRWLADTLQGEQARPRLKVTSMDDT